MSEVQSMLREAGFEIIKAYYSLVNDLTYIDADPKEYLRISSFKDMTKTVIKRPTKLNILRLLAYPIVNLWPSSRQLIVNVSLKIQEQAIQIGDRWG